MSDELGHGLRALQRDMQVREELQALVDDIHREFAKSEASVRGAIAHELYKALERLEAPPELLSIIGSYGDTLSDEEVLRLLKDWNAGGKVIHERQ